MNLIGLLPIALHQHTELKYALGVRRALVSTLSAGIEFGGNIRDTDDLALTPGLYLNLLNGLNLRFGTSIHLGSGSQHPTIRASVLYELTQ